MSTPVRISNLAQRPGEDTFESGMKTDSGQRVAGTFSHREWRERVVKPCACCFDQFKNIYIYRIEQGDYIFTVTPKHLFKQLELGAI